jgi:hypothetical protein
VRVGRRRLVIIGLDVLAAVLAVLAASIGHFGGLSAQLAGIRVSARTPGRALVALGAVLLLRLFLDRRTGPLGLARAAWLRLLPPPGSDPFLVPPPPGGLRRAVYAGLGLALALGVLLHDQLGQMSSVPDPGDPLFSMWRIGWVTHQIVRDPARLFDANIFHPEPLTLTFSDPMILTALLSAPLLALGVHPAVAYNVVFLLALWLSGVAAYLLVERLTGSARAAFVAGLTYACASFRFDHYSHLEIQMTCWMPLGLLALHHFLSTGRSAFAASPLRRGKWGYAIAFGLAAVAQLYSSMYFAVFFLLYVAIVGGSLLVLHRPPIRPLVLPIAAAAALAALLAIPLARPFLAAQPAKGDRGPTEVTYYSAEPADYLRANRFSALWKDRLAGAMPERALFPGAAPLALGALGLVPPLGTAQLAYAAGLLLSFDGTLGLKGLTYPYLYRWFAPIRGLRVPARFVAIVSLTLSILAGFGARQLLRRCGSQVSAHTVFAGLVGLVVADAWPALTLQPVFDPPPIYETLKDTPGAIVAEFPVPYDEIDNIPYMYFSLWHRARLVNGYSGFIPQSYAEYVKDVANFPDAAAMDAFRRHGVTHVTVNCGLGLPGCDALQARAKQSATLKLVVETVWRGQLVDLFVVGR